MSTISFIQRRKPVDQAWERYSALVRKAGADPKLWADRDHIEATFNAHEEFRRLYLGTP